MRVTPTRRNASAQLERCLFIVSYERRLDVVTFSRRLQMQKKMPTHAASIALAIEISEQRKSQKS